MSLTNFSHDCSLGVDAGNNISFRCTVKNVGKREGDEVLQVYHSVSEAIRNNVDHPVPFRKLVEFERVSLAPGASTSIVFDIPRERLAVTNSEGDYALYK